MKKIMLLCLTLVSLCASFANAGNRTLQCFAPVGVDIPQSGIYGLHIRYAMAVIPFSSGGKAQGGMFIQDKNGQVLAKVSVAASLEKNGNRANVGMAIYDAGDVKLASRSALVLRNRDADDSLSLDIHSKLNLPAVLDRKELGLSDFSILDDILVTGISFICNLR